MIVMIAGHTFLLDVRDLTIGRELPVMTGDAATCEIRKAEETNKTHHPKILLVQIERRTRAEQLPYRIHQASTTRIDRSSLLRWTPLISASSVLESTLLRVRANSLDGERSSSLVPDA